MGRTMEAREEKAPGLCVVDRSEVCSVLVGSVQVLFHDPLGAARLLFIAQKRPELQYVTSISLNP